ncbi:hypothetical protein COU78_04935 [Candidatus Peregrinibacteria bacterium CG10_big_fil_rev_8_21_14_0_10_49_24]|nr:MAG: hypothetical protein COV83_04080 [Candidatus Peregrinibacteria bacterium CG11_big_fil_rev_8_21_14_0_20_49_14]PIR50694.1 MAG: hypothetical protein COU78_04935 [Candidatus Peregrinibacteria bacterium CG10_big_fil_rev_8_21_14_0_10_49_24]PJA67456.1 MAG: hypothetical protein CO157_04635 [Candidatus Peregrinibacteria bacterium CG_4_9_14_3_um_filter_49_12]
MFVFSKGRKMKTLQISWKRILDRLVLWYQEGADCEPPLKEGGREGVEAMILHSIFLPDRFIPYVTEIALCYALHHKVMHEKPISEKMADDLMMKGLSCLSPIQLATLAVSFIQLLQLRERILVATASPPYVCHASYLEALHAATDEALSEVHLHSIPTGGTDEPTA